uniref:C3H1-type domain-containing protein n=1 Tax=Hyaloperonospora arabidopsidis (strain Emoy2) TaxID=559515 RepID=M4C1T7_HYAAE
MSYNRRGGFGGRSRGRGGNRGGNRSSYNGGRGGSYTNASSVGNEVCRRYMDSGKCDFEQTSGGRTCRYPHFIRTIGATRGHSGAIKDVVMWPERQQLFTCSADASIKLWDCATWQEVTTISVQDALPPSSNSTGTGGGIPTTSSSYNTTGGAPRSSNTHSSSRDAGPAPHTDGVMALVLCGPFLFAGFAGCFRPNPKVSIGKVRGWNLETPQAPPFEFITSESLPFAHTMSVQALAVATDRTGNATLFSGSADGCIRYWQMDTSSNQFKCRGVLDGHVRGVTRLKTFAVGGVPILASASVDSTIRLWDLATYQCVKVLSAEENGHLDAVMDLEFWLNKNETFLISGGLDAEIIVWGLTPPFQQLFKETQDSQVTALCGMQDAAQAPILLIGMADGTISVKELPSFAYKTTLGADLNQGHHDAVRRITTGPSNTFFSTGNDRKMIAWQITGDVNSIQSK